MPRKLQIELFLLDNLIWVILAGFFLLNAMITPMFATYTNLVNIFYHSAIMSMLVLGEGLIMVIGQLDLSNESTLVFAPGVAMLLATRWLPFPLDPVTAIILTLVIGALIGLFNGICIAKIEVNPFLQTLSMMIILRGLALFLIPLSIFPLDKVYSYAGQARMIGNIPVAIPIVLIIFLIFHFIMQLYFRDQHQKDVDLCVCNSRFPGRGCRSFSGGQAEFGLKFYGRRHGIACFRRRDPGRGKPGRGQGHTAGHAWRGVAARYDLKLAKLAGSRCNPGLRRPGRSHFRGYCPGPRAHQGAEPPSPPGAGQEVSAPGTRRLMLQANESGR